MPSLFLVEIDGCEQSMDIAILADTSRSMTDGNRQILKNATYRLVDELGVSETGNHFGFVTADVKATLHSKFSDSISYNATELKSKVKTEVDNKPTKDSTRTDLAMQLIEKDLFTSAGGHRNSSKSVLVVITDGRPVYRNPELDEEPQINTSRITELLEVIIFNFSLDL